MPQPELRLRALRRRLRQPSPPLDSGASPPRWRVQHAHRGHRPGRAESRGARRTARRSGGARARPGRAASPRAISSTPAVQRHALCAGSDAPEPHPTPPARRRHERQQRITFRQAQFDGQRHVVHAGAVDDGMRKLGFGATVAAVQHPRVLQAGARADRVERRARATSTLLGLAGARVRPRCEPAAAALRQRHARRNPACAGIGIR